MKFTIVSTLPTLYLLTALSALILAARSTDNPTSSLFCFSPQDSLLSTPLSPPTPATRYLTYTVCIERPWLDLTTAEIKALSWQFQALTTSFKATISGLFYLKALAQSVRCLGQIIQSYLSKAPEKESIFATSFAEGILATIQEGLDIFGNIADSTTSCLPDPAPAAHIKLCSYKNSNSSAPGNATSTQVPTGFQQSTAPGTPSIRMVRIGVLGVAVVVTL
ncbi:uncharacterized protein BDW70DRAFT_154527 [Aspergillus foveolatus]|uniref:uncharacterized protein n=1 Tax=Aspergillus foveolatus TaxID=210207 RepID=UPI003CCD581C